MDILNNYKKGDSKTKTSTEGAASAAPETSTSTSTASAEMSRGVDMIGQMGSKTSDETAARSNQVSADERSTSSKVEPSGSDAGKNSDSDWTMDSAFKEIKKLREENKSYRIKYEEKIEKLSAEAQVRLQQKEQEAKDLLKAKEELDKIKEDQEDKKRDLAERLSVREAKLSETQTLLKIKEENYQKQLQERDARIASFEAEREAEAQVYKNRLDEELAKVPEQYREYANLLVKGAGDPRDALVALNEVRIKGMFEDKTVIVNHNVPGAKDGARASQERLQEVERQNRASMSSNQKIKTALEQIKGGQRNTAFRTK